MIIGLHYSLTTLGALKPLDWPLSQSDELLLILANTVIFGSESRRIHDHVLLSHDSHVPDRKKHRFQQFFYCCVRIRCRDTYLAVTTQRTM
jgi:hypothetical protein